MPIDLNILTAFLAGLLSFLAPCTFSTIPVFLSYISGVTLSDPDEAGKKFGKVFKASLFYALGFIMFFAILGLGLNFLGGIFAGTNRNVWRIVGGIIIILLGLYMLFQDKFRIEFLMGEHKVRLKRFGDKDSRMIYIWSFIIGFVNAFSWSPCIGPIYGQISTLAISASSAKAWSGFFYSIVYAIGLMVPFVLMAIFFGSSQKIVKKLSKYSGVVYKVMAVIFILMGFLLVTNLFNTVLVSQMFRIFGFFGFDETQLPL